MPGAVRRNDNTVEMCHRGGGFLEEVKTAGASDGPTVPLRLRVPVCIGSHVTNGTHRRSPTRLPILRVIDTANGRSTPTRQLDDKRSRGQAFVGEFT